VFNIFLPFLKKMFSSDLNIMFNVSTLGGFLIWPLLGWVLHNYEFKRWHKAIIHVVGLAGLMLHICGTYYLSVEAGHVDTTFKGYENVPSVVYAVSVFVFLKDLGRWVMERERLAKFVKVVGRYAFEIYLLQFILLDEPFAGVDPLAVADIQEIIQYLRQRGMGILITDHNVRETLQIVDRAYILNQGEILLEGDSQTIAESPIAKKFYLGEKFTL
jgi:hypothetical protein